MRKNGLVIILLLIGSSILLYPSLANLVSTTGHVAESKKYEDIMMNLSQDKKDEEKKKAEKHNKEIKKQEQVFIDPFANGTKEAGSISYYDALNIGEVMAVLKIPKLSLELPIYHGSGERVLSKGVGHLENSALPVGGVGAHSVLTAHRGLPSSKLFRDLDKLETGDIFFVEILDEVHKYEIFEELVVLPDQTDWLEQEEDKDLITLLTCEPYMINTHRLLVTGHRVEYTEEDKNLLSENREEIEKSSLWLWVIGVIVIISVLFISIYLVIRQRNKKRRKHRRNQK